MYLCVKMYIKMFGKPKELGKSVIDLKQPSFLNRSLNYRKLNSMSLFQV